MLKIVVSGYYKMLRLVLKDTVKRRFSRHVIPGFIIWLAPQAGKMKRILCSDWLPKGQDRPILPARDFPFCSRKSEIFGCNLLAIK